jgi:hypothetical protein
MIKFFRKIRQDLLSKGKTEKYFKYAIGEIVLVVLGILIALQINNWNEDRKFKNQELKLVKQLLEDAKNDSIFYNSRLDFFNDQISSYQLLSNLCNNSISNVDSIFFKHRGTPFKQAANNSAVVTNNDDYTKISNESIKKSLREYATNYSYIDNAIDLHSNVISEERKYLVKNYDFKHYNLDSIVSLNNYSILCKEPKIKGIIEICMGSTNNAQKQTKRFITSNSDLIKTCKTFLND